MSIDPTESQPDTESDAATPQTQPRSSEEVAELNSTEQIPADTSDTKSISTATARQPILIGSQRDPANVQLRPPKPKAVLEAEVAPLKTEDEAVEQQVESSTPAVESELAAPVSTAVEEADAQSADAQSAEAPPAEMADEDMPLDAPTTMDLEASAENLDNEVEAALNGMSIDELVEQHDPAKAAEVLEENSRHKGTVIKVHRDNVFFTLRGRHQGVASLKQFKKPPKSGAQMDVVITNFNAEDGLYELHIPGAAVSVADWDDLQDGAVVEARVTGANTGGLECLVNNIRGFIPASQIALYHVDNLSEFINQKMQCVVTEANRRRRNLVLSHRAVLEREQEENRQKLLDQLEAGQICEGVVRKLQDFGAFVELAPGIDGLVHISKLSWDHVQHPSEAVEVGQKIRVKIEKIDKQSGKIGLTIRDLMDHPWTNIDQKYHPNTVVNGTVSRIAKFGAFVKLEPGVEGLVHISELAHQHVANVGSVVDEGQTLEVQVLSVDPEAQRIALSLKATLPEPESPRAADDSSAEAARDSLASRRSKPLKGGTDRKSGGEQFGLNW